MQNLWQDLHYGARMIVAGIVISVMLLGFTTTGAQDAKSAQAPKAAAIIAELQRALEEEVATTPSLPGELLHIHAPKLGIDRSFAVGLFDRQSKRPLEPRHVFRIASVTKTFVAAAILRLHEDGKLNINDPINRYLPKEYAESLEEGGYPTREITLRHLLTHTSGIHDYAIDSKYMETVLKDPKHRWTRMEQVQFALKYGKPHFVPGSGFHYSDTGYVLLGEIVERASRQDLAMALRTLLNFKKLGLDETWLETLEPAPRGVKEISHPYLGLLDAIVFDPSTDLYGGGGLVSSVEDQARFFRALLTNQVFRKPQTLQTMLEIPAVNRTASLRNYAMGILLRNAKEDCWGHTGFWGTMVFYCPRSDVAIARHLNQAQPEKSFRINNLMLKLIEQLGLGQ
ncbi:MAG: serine hydrolase domain-containing protein [Blastocatellia bacterium]